MKTRTMLAMAAAMAMAGCTTQTMIGSGACPPGKKCRNIGGYSLPRLVLDYTLEQDGNGAITTNVRERIVPGKWISLDYAPATSGADELSYELDGGFLKTARSSADDKSAIVVAEILKIFTAPPAEPPGALLVTPAKTIAFTISPGQANLASGMLGAELGLCITAVAQGTSPASNTNGITNNPGNGGGFFYPIEQPWRITVWDPDPGASLPAGGCGARIVGKLIDDRVFTVPSEVDFARIDADRTRWVKHEVNIDFDKGRLVKVEVKKPSEAAAFASIPANVLKTLVGIPAELVQFKIDTSGKEKALATALKAQLEAEQAYLKALKDAKATNSSDAPASDADKVDDLN